MSPNQINNYAKCGTADYLNHPALVRGIHNNRIAILARHPKVIKDTSMPDCCSVLNLIPASKIISAAVSKIIDGPYAVFI